MDWIENAGLYSRLQSWQRDIEFIFGRLLNKRTTKMKANYLMCWLGQRPKNHLLSQNTEFIDYKEIFRVLKEFMNFTQLLVWECKYPLDSDRLLSDVIVSGVNSITSYKQCIGIGIKLTL